MLCRHFHSRTIARRHRSSSQWTARQWPPSGTRSFHSYPQNRLASSDPSSFEPGKTYYDILGLTQGAAPGEIKRKFYEASKIYHPDRNKDSNAATHFVKLSQAYHVLSNANEKAAYDRTLNAHQAAYARSSNYAAPGPAGGRPASGLSRRRTTMRGPPPSYYRNQAYTGGGTQPRTGTSSNERRTYDPSGGMGVGGQPSGTNHDVPHFNWNDKYKQHHDYQQRQRKAAWSAAEAEYLHGANFWFQAAVVGASVLFAGAMGGWLAGRRDRNKSAS